MYWGEQSVPHARGMNPDGEGGTSKIRKKFSRRPCEKLSVLKSGGQIYHPEVRFDSPFLKGPFKNYVTQTKVGRYSGFCDRS